MVGWLSGWSYRQSRLVSHATGSGTNYQVRIKVHSGTGTSTATDVYLNNHCLHFPYDIDLAYDVSGTATQLKFFVDDLTVNPISVWIKITPDLTSTDQTFYIYYGNDSQTTTLEDGVNTFPLLFDDFSGSAYNSSIWTYDNGLGSKTVSGSILTLNGSSPILGSGNGYGIGHSLMFRASLTDASHQVQLGGYASNAGAVPMQNIQTNYPTAAIFNARVYNGGGVADNLGDLGNAYHIWELLYLSGHCTFTKDYSAIGTDHTTYIPTGTLYPVLTGSGDTGATIAADWVAIRNYTSPEPAMTGDWGAEEGIATLSGITRDSNGNILGGCTVLLFRTSDKAFQSSVTSNVSTGVYSFAVSPSINYFVVAFLTGSPDVMGVTDNNIQGS